MGSLEGLLQLLQLFSSEGGPAPALLALQGQVRFGLHVRAFIQPVTWEGKETGSDVHVLEKPKGERAKEPEQNVSGQWRGTRAETVLPAKPLTNA